MPFGQHISVSTLVYVDKKYCYLFCLSWTLVTCFFFLLFFLFSFTIHCFIIMLGPRVVAVIVWLVRFTTTYVVSSNLDQGEVYNIMWYSLSVTCDRSMVFSGSSGFLHQYENDRHDITELFLKVASNTNKQTNKLYNNDFYCQYLYKWIELIQSKWTLSPSGGPVVFILTSSTLSAPKNMLVGLYFIFSDVTDTFEIKSVVR